jgi:hypothetical protein
MSLDRQYFEEMGPEDFHDRAVEYAQNHPYTGKAERLRNHYRRGCDLLPGQIINISHYSRSSKDGLFFCIRIFLNATYMSMFVL